MARPMEGNCDHSPGQPRIRTFEERVQDALRGGHCDSFSAFCRDTLHLDTGDYHELYGYLSGYLAAACCRTLLRRIAAQLGETVEDLFPPELYRRQLFHSIAEAPAFRLIQQRRGIDVRRTNQYRGSLLEYCTQQGLNKQQYSILYHVLLGITGCSEGKRAFFAQALHMSEEELLPPDVYAQAEPERIPFSAVQSAASFDSSSHIRRTITSAFAGQTGDPVTETSAEVLEQIMQRLLNDGCLTERQSTTCRAHLASAGRMQWSGTLRERHAQAANHSQHIQNIREKVSRNTALQVLWNRYRELTDIERGNEDAMM